MLLIYLLSLLLGIFVGSLINYAAYKIYGNFKGEFKCPNCKHKLRSNEVVSIISYLTFQNRCSFCNKLLPKKYPIVEALTGLIFTFIAYNVNLNFFESGINEIELFKLIFGWFAASYLIMIISLDTKWYIIPEKLTSAGLVLTILLLSVGTFILNIYTLEELSLRIITAFITFLTFFVVFMFSSKRAISFSDVKFVTFIALLFSFPNIISVFIFTFLSGTIAGLILVLLKKKTIKSKIPFSPFLIIGTVIALVYGSNVAEWYLSFCK